MVMGAILIVVLGTLGLMWISERCRVPWEREVSIGKRREVAWDERVRASEEIIASVASIDWSTIEPNKTYELALALGDIEDDFDWGEFV